MMCDRCEHALEVVEDKNKLSEIDQKKCRDAIQWFLDQIRIFNNYVVPEKFFGPGSLSAYVSPSMTQHKDDLSNVNFDLDKIGSEFHGFVRKRKAPRPLTMSQDKVNELVEDLADEINFYYAQEVKKR